MSTTAQTTALADGLRALAAMADNHLEEFAAANVHWWFKKINIPIGPGNADAVRLMARAGVRAGAKVDKHQNDQYAGVNITFGAVGLHVYIDREEICEKVVTGTREVTEEVRDPEALAAVPMVSVTKTIEDVEWVCKPLLSEVA